MRVKKISQRSIGLLRRKPSAKQKNLEKKRGLFFEIGLVVSLSIVFLAFEWTTVRTNKMDWNNLGRGEIIEELAEVSFHKKKIEMPKPKIIQAIELVPDEIDTDEDLVISIENTDETVNDLDFIINEIEEIVEEEPVPLYNLEKWPEFPGGESAMMTFLSNNLKYTASAHAINLEGTVYVYFVIWKDGSIRNIEIKRGVGAGLDEEVVRVIGIMPKWTPGTQNGRNVSVIYNLPVKFKLN
jgi:protein TonB